MQRVVIIDYGSGNLHSAAKAFERAARESGHESQIIVSPDPKEVARADRIVLPGVGAYADCKRGLDRVPGLIDTLEDAVRRKGRPFLGICVGMQLLSERGLEFEVTKGLGWIKGEVVAITPNDPALKIPHMGWNTLTVLPKASERVLPEASKKRVLPEASERVLPEASKKEAKPHALLAGIATGPNGLHAYFVHSFHLAAADRHVVVAETDYGGPVTAMVADGNIAGTQFHPEKSQKLGLKLLGNFLGWRV